MKYRIDNETKYWRDRNKAQITNVVCRGMKINIFWVKNWFRIWITKDIALYGTLIWIQTNHKFSQSGHVYVYTYMIYSMLSM